MLGTRLPRRVVAGGCTNSNNKSRSSRSSRSSSSSRSTSSSSSSSIASNNGSRNDSSRSSNCNSNSASNSRSDRISKRNSACSCSCYLGASSQARPRPGPLGANLTFSRVVLKKTFKTMKGGMNARNATTTSRKVKTRAVEGGAERASAGPSSRLQSVTLGCPPPSLPCMVLRGGAFLGAHSAGETHSPRYNLKRLRISSPSPLPCNKVVGSS